MKSLYLAAGAALGLLAAASPAAAGNGVKNGSFEVTTNGIGQFDNNTQAKYWTSGGYNFLFDGNNPTGNSVGQYGALSLWGPGNGSNNGLTASPFGGNFVGADGAFGVSPIEQTLHNLTAGHSYAVDFYWGGIQQYGFDGAQTEQWIVSLGGGASQSTAVYNNPSHGFSGWTAEHFVFVAPHSGDNVLSFLAHGTPDGVPPFSLLDGVSAAVPEPGVWALLIGGFGLVGAAARRRRLATATAA